MRVGASYYYDADGLGSITSLTDASGQIAATYTYDSFGKLTASTGTVTNPFRYTGREFDSSTGLYYYRARYYDSSVGRFISEDPIGFNGGSNFYRYGSNSPVLFADSSGLIACEQMIRNLLNHFVSPCIPGPFNSKGTPVTSNGHTGRGQNGGHQNYKITSDPLSPDQLLKLRDALTDPDYGKPFGPCCRIPGTGLHVESPTVTDAPNNPGEQELSVTVHVDLGNPNSGPRGFAEHVVVDGGVGHLEDIFNKLFQTHLNLDLNCEE